MLKNKMKFLGNGYCRHTNITRDAYYIFYFIYMNTLKFVVLCDKAVKVSLDDLEQNCAKRRTPRRTHI